jgi:hypothetical protein
MAKDTCIMCGKETAYDFETHIDYRIGYVEGAGQLCYQCYTGTETVEDQYSVSNIMKRRTTLITVSHEEVFNTPNDADLGELVRRKYWESLGM